MAAEIKASVKARFPDGGKPTGDDFGVLIDSYQDTSYAGTAILTITSGAAGAIDIQSSASATTRTTGTVGIQLLEASATSQVGSLASAGNPVVSAAGTPGLALVSADSASSARALLEVSAATSAEISARTASSGKFATPDTVGAHPGMAKFWVRFAGTDASVASHFNVSGVSDEGTGIYKVSFVESFANTSYVVNGMAHNNSGVVSVVTVQPSAGMSVSAVQVQTNNNDTNALVDASAVMLAGWGAQ